MSSAASSADEGALLTERPAATCSVLIPAFDEAATVAHVVEAAVAADLGPVVVVDDGSHDETARSARNAGAKVMKLDRNLGKGGAVAAGIADLESDVVILIDADLVGLEPRHLQELAHPVMTGAADMARGVFTGGRWRTTAAQRLTPQLSGQRALRRDLLAAVPRLAASRYGVEVAITEAGRRQGWRCVDVPLEGVSQVMKEEKRGLLSGITTRLAMYRDIIRALIGRGR